MEMNRREFALAAAAAVTMTCLVPGLACAESAMTEPLGGYIVDAGMPDDYPSDGVYDQFAKSDKVLIVRCGDTIHAASARCTHLSCILHADSGEIRCPCHGSRFTADGKVEKGPAKEPLVRYGISLKHGRIMVDTGIRIEEAKWNDPGSFVKVS